MDVLANLATAFIGLFQEGGKVFMSLATGILPTLITLIVFVNSIIKFVGEEKVHGLAQSAAKYTVTRYTVMPLLAVFFLTNPMCYTFGKFLPEKYKPAFYDAAVSFVHPITGLFPHANAGELFVYMGIAAGIQNLGYSLGPLAVRYFLVGLLVILIRGIVTETLTLRMMAARSANGKVSA